MNYTKLMIQSKEDLRAYLNADQKMYGKPNRLFVKWLTRSDEYYIRAFMVVLRHYEYYLNKRRSLLDFIPYIFYWWNYRRLKLKSGIYIYPALLLLRAAKAAKEAAEFNNNEQMVEFLRNNKAFWKFCGIFTIVCFGLCILAGFVGVIVAIAAL